MRIADFSWGRSVLALTGLLLLVFLAARPAAAQSSTGAITGTITDPSGLAVAGASVTIHSEDTGIDAALTTNDAGLYVAPYLQPGNYEVSATKSGFQTATTKGIVVHVGDKVTLDLPLQLGTEATTVTVTEVAPLIETSKSASEQTVDQNLVEDLPIATRRWESFQFLTPGVTTDGNSGLSSFRGISSLYNGNSVDGANNTQAFFSEARGRAIIVTYVYSPDSIQEFEVSGSNYSAEFGQAAGGVVNAVTRSGTNQVHGDLFYDLRYPSLNALDPFGKSRGTLTQTVHQQNHFGGSVGAPIIKDKLFFFGTYDGFRKVNPILYLSTQTNATINGFTCPLSASATACANGKGYLESQLGAFPRDLKQDVALGKLDYQLNAKNHLSAVFNWQDWKEPYGYNTSATVTNGGESQNGPGGTHERFVIGHWTTAIGSNKVNEALFQWGQDFEFDSANAGGPNVSLSNLAAYGETNALPRPAFPDEHRTELGDNFSLVEGSHTLRMGVDLNFIHELLINLFQGAGSYSYNTTSAFDGCATGSSSAAQANTEFCRWLDDSVGANTGDGLTSQHYGSFTQVTDPITHVGRDDFGDNDTAAYLEDAWRIKPKLTLNLGVRYDLQHVPAPPRPNTATPLLAFYTSTLNIDKNNVAPRIGVAWQVKPNTVVRVGYGIFYGKTSNSTYYALRVENGVFQQTISGCLPTSTNPTLKACAPTFPNVFFTPPGPALAAPFAGALTPVAVIPAGGIPSLSQAAHGMSPSFVNPAAHEGEVSIEHELPGRVAISATYLLTRGLHLPSSYDANVAPATTTRSYDVLNATGGTVLTTTVPFYTTRLNTTTGIIDAQFSSVNSWYNGLLLTARKPFSHGLELLLNYTFSKALDDGEVAGSNGTFFGTDGVTDPYDLKQDYGYSDLDQRHRFVGSAVWRPNFFANYSKAPHEVLDGWEFSGIFTAATGQPYSALITNSTLYSGSVDGGMTGGVISTNAAATGGRAAWLMRNSFNLPNFQNIDFRLGRDFAIKEKYHLAFAVDAFNLFNSTIVTGENTSAYSYVGAGAQGCVGHTNGCLIPSSSFRSITTTSGSLFGARQLQFNARFEF